LLNGRGPNSPLRAGSRRTTVRVSPLAPVRVGGARPTCPAAPRTSRRSPTAIRSHSPWRALRSSPSRVHPLDQEPWGHLPLRLVERRQLALDDLLRQALGPARQRQQPLLEQRADQPHRLAYAGARLGQVTVRQYVDGLRTTTVTVTATGSWTIYKWAGSSPVASSSTKPTCRSSGRSAPPGTTPWSPAGASIRSGCSTGCSA
jgi:hypothetical protein